MQHNLAKSVRRAFLYLPSKKLSNYTALLMNWVNDKFTLGILKLRVFSVACEMIVAMAYMPPVFIYHSIIFTHGNVVTMCLDVVALLADMCQSLSNPQLCVDLTMSKEVYTLVRRCIVYMVMYANKCIKSMNNTISVMYFPCLLQLIERKVQCP